MIQSAIDAKREWQEDADECMRFFNGPYEFMYGLENQNGSFAYTGIGKKPQPSITMTVNKVAEAVQLFGPSLYHQNPVRTVSPRQLPEVPLDVFGDPNDPMTQVIVQQVLSTLNQQTSTDKARASLMSGLLNYMPVATNLKFEMRQAIDEAIIKGMGVLWTDAYTPVGSNHKLVGSLQDSVDNLLLDPDAKRWDDMKWVAKICVKPVWEVEAEYGLPSGSLKANNQSYSQDAAISAVVNEYKKREGKTNDLLVYFKIWSKMGLGALLRGADEKAAEADRFGQFVHVAVCHTCEFPLNLPPTIWQNEDEMYRRAQWETPYWADDGWPFERIAFHHVPNQLWPMSHFKPAMGELKFINWAFSFLISKVFKTSRDFLAFMAGMDEESKSKILNSTKDFESLEFKISQGIGIKDMVQFLQHPEMNRDLFDVITAVMDLFEKRVGLTELMYGASNHQYRSAAEADAKQASTSIRPDDMANVVEDAAGKLSQREAFALRWHLKGADVAAMFGPVFGKLWDMLIAPADPNAISRQLQYRIEQDSARKPNKRKAIDDANQAMQLLFPFYSQMAMATGQVGQFNSLVALWGKAFDVDTSGLVIQPPPPPPPPQPMPGAPGEPPQPQGP